MHHAGCTTNISDLHARRVLGRKEYRKFVDFYDRSVLGEGIHCLKCGSFVNLPRDGDPMVQCCVIINRNDAGLVIFDLYTGAMSVLRIQMVRPLQVPLAP